MVIGDRDWSSLHEMNWRQMNPRDYLALVRGSHRLEEILRYAHFMGRDDQVLSKDNVVLTT